MKLYKIIIVLLLGGLLHLNTFAQTNQYGLPFITHYTPKDYNADNTNWCITQDTRGVMYIGNTQGVLIFDGKDFELVPVSNNSLVLSLAVDNNGVVYVGAAGDVGYIIPEGDKGYTFHSLINKFDTTQKTVLSSKFNRTFITDRTIYFCSLFGILAYDKKTHSTTTYTLPSKSFTSFKMGNTIYTGNYEKGLMTLTSTGIKYISDLFASKDIISMLPYSNSEYLMLVRPGGLMIYNFRKNSLRPLTDLYPQAEATNKTIGNFYTATAVNKNLYLIGTIGDGAFLIDKKGEIIQHYDKDAIGNNVVINTFVSKLQPGILWVAQETGFSKIEFSVPIYSFKHLGLKSNPIQINEFNHNIFLGSNDGLSILSTKNNRPSFDNISALKAIIYSLRNFTSLTNDSLLLIGTTSGTFAFDKQQTLKPIVGDSLIVIDILTDSSFENTVFFSHEKGVFSMTFDNGKFTNYQPLPFSDIIVKLAVDANKKLWAASFSNGLYCYDLSTKKVKNYTTKDGLPDNTNLSIYVLNNTLYVTSISGIYKYLSKKDSFELTTDFGKPFTTGLIKSISQDRFHKNIFWINKADRMHKVIIGQDSIQDVYNPFLRLPKVTIENVFQASNGVLWLGTSDGLFTIIDDVANKNTPAISYLPSFKDLLKNKPLNPILTSSLIPSVDSNLFKDGFVELKITGANDTSFVVSTQQPQSYVPTLTYALNNLTFKFSSPSRIGEDKIRYSYKLEGFDKHWSKWSSETKVVYSFLNEGEYTFLVKSKNAFDIESSPTAYHFTILPPWYKTIWAYIAYFVIALVIIVFIVKIYTRKLERDKKRLEAIVQERTAEVVEQKAVIEEKNKDITDSIRYAEQIQIAVLPKQISGLEEHLEAFIYFRPKDIVSGDFYFVRHMERAKVLLATAVDCTGHGVPGAFMSLLGVTFLNEIITKPEITTPDTVLNELRDSVIKSLNQSKGDNEQKKRDGMDLAMVAYEYENKVLNYSGANNPLYLIRKNENPEPEGFDKKLESETEPITLYEFKANRMPIGLYDKLDPFTNTRIDILPGDVIYFASDGYADQFGGEKGKKYTYKRMKRLLLSLYNVPLSQQEQILDEEMLKWRGVEYTMENGVRNIISEKEEQIDDQIIIGIRF